MNQVVVGSFLAGNQHEQEQKKQKHEPYQSPPQLQLFLFQVLIQTETTRLPSSAEMVGRHCRRIQGIAQLT